MHAKKMSMPLMCGFTTSRWSHAVQFMLPKQPGCFDLNALRIIQLVEADLNMAAKIVMGRKLIHRIEDNNNMPAYQHGFRPNKTAIGIATLKRLSYDFLALTRQNAIIFNNDAKACFDRIVPIVAAIAMRHQGLDKWSTASFLEILLGMRYQIRTALGISENDFSNLHDTLLGVLQGVGWSTTTWLLISVILLCCIEKRSPGINIINPQQTIHLKRAAETFADDADLWMVFPTSFDTACKDMTAIAQYWEQLC